MSGYFRRVRRACVLCELVAGVRGHEHEVVWRDGQGIVSLAKYPVAWGHLLVAPVEHREHVVGDFDLGAAVLVAGIDRSGGGTRSGVSGPSTVGPPVVGPPRPPRGCRGVRPTTRRYSPARGAAPYGPARLLGRRAGRPPHRHMFTGRWRPGIAVSGRGQHGARYGGPLVSSVVPTGAPCPRSARRRLRSCDRPGEASVVDPSRITSVLRWRASVSPIPTVVLPHVDGPNHENDSEPVTSRQPTRSASSAASLASVVDDGPGCS